MRTAYLRALAAAAGVGLVAGCSSSPGGNSVTPDSGTPDSTAVSCGGAGQVCCNGTACNAGLTCVSATCNGGSSGSSGGGSSSGAFDGSSGGPSEGGSSSGGPVDGGGDQTSPSDGAGPPDASTDGGGGEAGSDSGGDVDGGGEAGSDGGGDGSVDGSDSGTDWCSARATLILGVHIRFNVAWPATVVENGGSGAIDEWLLYSAASTDGGPQLSGAASTCGITFPDQALNVVGQAAVCPPGGTCGSKVQTQIAGTIARTFPLPGTQTGWGAGTTLTASPAVRLLGLAGTSSYASATTAWPASYCTSNCTPAGLFAATDVTDDDADGDLGVTIFPKNDTGGSPTYTYPPTSGTPLPTPLLADRVDVVLRDRIAFTGMRMTDCVHGAGTASITLFDTHVIGCNIHNPAAPCASAQVSFLDQNRPIYGPDSTHTASPSTPISGTVTFQALPASATCADARAIP